MTAAEKAERRRAWLEVFDRVLWSMFERRWVEQAQIERAVLAQQGDE
jgi:hypothetical protein